MSGGARPGPVSSPPWELELTYAPDRQRWLHLSDEALEEARRSNDPVALATVLAARAYSIHAPGNVAERWANANELLIAAERLGDPALLAWGYFHRYGAAMVLGKAPQAAADLAALERIAEELGQPTLRWCAAWCGVGHLVYLGRLEEAEARGDLVIELGESTGQPDRLIFAMGVRFAVRLQQGRLEDVRELLLATIRSYPAATVFPVWLALLETETGRLDEAAELLEKLAASDFADVPLDTLWPVTMVPLAVVAARLGDRRRSAILHGLLTPWADEIAGTRVVWLGSLHHYLGLLTTVLGRYDEAEAHFSRAEADHRRVEARCWLAHTRLEWARMLLARGETDDAPRARGLLDQAGATATALALGRIEREVEVLLRQAE